MTERSFTEVSKPGEPPKIWHSYAARPSWKAYGTGRKIIDISITGDGSLYINCRELSENGRTGKETYVTLPAELARVLAGLIAAYKPKSASGKQTEER